MTYQAGKESADSNLKIWHSKLDSAQLGHKMQALQQHVGEVPIYQSCSLPSKNVFKQFAQDNLYGRMRAASEFGLASRTYA